MELFSWLSLKNEKNTKRLYTQIVFFKFFFNFLIVNKTLMSRAFMRVVMIGKSVLRMWSPYVTALLSILSSVYGVSSVILSIVLLCLCNEPLFVHTEIIWKVGEIPAPL